MPADSLLHPLAVLAVALLVANDHVLKSLWPGLVTGKLSDVAGLAFFPLVILGIWEVALSVVGRWSGPGRRPVMVASAVTGIAFILVKTTAVGAAAFGWALSFGQWLPSGLTGVITNRPTHLGAPAPVVADVTDLVALPALLLAVYVGLHRRSPAVDESGSPPQL